MINSSLIRFRNLIKIKSDVVKPFEDEKKYISTGDFDSEQFELVTYENKPSRANLIVKEGQITLAKMKGTEKVRIVTKEMENNIYSTGFFAIEPKNIDIDFLYYVMKSSEFIQEKDSYSYGTTQFSINEDRLKNIKIRIVLDKEHQIRISNLLRRKLQDIDKLVDVENQQIEKIKEYMQSLIAESVLKGIDKNVSLKKSGVEWIGEIPNEWDVVRIKDAFILNNERTEEINLNNVNLISLYTDKGVVQHSDLVEITGNKAVTAEGYKLVRKNDIVVNIILCWMGAVGMSNYDGVTSPAYDIYHPKSNIISKYYHYLFRTKRFNGECFRYGRGIMMMRWRTYSNEFLSIHIPLPSYDEQAKIVDYLDKKCDIIERLINIKKQKIERLVEYKKSLIYEYVTGEKEVY